MTDKKEKLKFIFPNLLAKAMKNVDMRAQQEASMLSMFFIIVGMCLMAVYMVFFGDVGLAYKILILFNLFCAFIFISSFLITTYQQYVSYMEISGIDPDKHKAEIRKRGNIFKRIKLAIQEKRNKKKEMMQPPIVKEAIENMVEIKQEELKEYQKIEEQAKKLKADQINIIEKGVKEEWKKKF